MFDAVSEATIEVDAEALVFFHVTGNPGCPGFPGCPDDSS
jgi:hypothetical protein